MKDLFSKQAKLYAAFRPTYPPDLYAFIFDHVKNKKVAWDCATGNGQVAKVLATTFDEVYATDISQKQLDYAARARNIYYSKSPAEKTTFPENHFDLITVAQALHWFDRSLFYEEVKRIGKRGGILAVWGYAMLFITPPIDAILLEFYNETVGPYWDDARRLVEQKYQPIEFPFEEIKVPDFSITVQWTLDQLAGYLSSWSATQKYIQERGKDPVPTLVDTLNAHWSSSVMTVSFPIFGRMGRVA